MTGVQTCALPIYADGKLVGVLAIDCLDGQVQAIRSVVNPDKLRHLGETSQAFLRANR